MFIFIQYRGDSLDFKTAIQIIRLQPIHLCFDIICLAIFEKIQRRVTPAPRISTSRSSVRLFAIKFNRSLANILEHRAPTSEQYMYLVKQVLI
jgi:hypothetical protein